MQARDISSQYRSYPYAIAFRAALPVRFHGWCWKRQKPPYGGFNILVSLMFFGCGGAQPPIPTSARGSDLGLVVGHEQIITTSAFARPHLFTPSLVKSSARRFSSIKIGLDPEPDGPVAKFSPLLSYVSLDDCN